MKAAAALFKHNDGELWRESLAGYARCVAHLAKGDGGKRKPKPHLVEDDVFLHGSADGGPSAAAALLEQKAFSAEALQRVMRWKLARGKFRVGLQKLAESNADAAVAKACTDGYAALASENVRPALKAVAQLKGIGPATASLVLSLNSATMPFMSDEAYEACLGAKPKNYSEKEYLLFHSAVAAKVASLNGGGEGWTAGGVERALWACWYHNEHLDDEHVDADGGSKRKADDDSSAPGVAKPAKRTRK